MNAHDIQPAGASALADQFDAWHPGIESQVPARLLHRATIFRPENSFTTVEKARELRDFTWLEYRDIVAWRPERLALHELLIRVTADFSVPDGPRVEDLGINFRKSVRALLTRYIDPRMPEIVAIYEAARRDLANIINAEVARLDPMRTQQQDGVRTTGLYSLVGFFSSRRAERQTGRAQNEHDIVAEWQAAVLTTRDPLRRTALRALVHLIAAINVRHGSARGAHGIIASLAIDIASNDFAAQVIGAAITPWLREAARADGYRLLPAQDGPVVMNTKGASAAGKSTIRPLQRELARDIGVRWDDFALISPDIWRKQLLDYASLGNDYKYGAALTADELHVIDQKLDQYMAIKAERAEMTHLLIDRFRFDSFAPDSQEAGSNLLTRFGQVVYLFFMITPPASLVERAWKRGLELGRYKAVDDTLAHAVEAYSGIPSLFFTWVERKDKRVHFEFLDNSVALGERPRTIAFGTNETLCILDAGAMLDIERYRSINIDAKSPAQLYADPALLPAERNLAFVTDCIRRFSTVYFAEQDTGRIYLELRVGKCNRVDPHALERAMADADTRAALPVSAVAASATVAYDHAQLLQEIEPDALTRTLGQWAGRR